MNFLRFILRYITQTEALKKSSGYLETAFFESAYRVTYLSGFSVWDKSLLYRLYSGTVKLMIGLFIASEFWYLFSQSSNLDRIIDNINVTLIHVIAIYRYTNMIGNKDIYRKLAVSMESPYFDMSTFERKKIVEMWALRNERFLKLLLAIGTCTLGAWYIYPLVDDLEYNLTVAVRLPFDYNTPYRYPLAYILVLVAFNYTSYFVMVNDLIMQAHLMHLLCQFMVLADCFENILVDCSDETTDLDQNITNDDEFIKRYVKRFNNLVDQHKFILDNTMELRKSLSAPMLGQLAASGMLICFAAYQVISNVTISIVKFLMSLLYLSYNMFELFIFCRWCDEIKIQSENISDAVYCSGWEQGLTSVPGLRQTLLLVAMRARKPLVLSAGGLCDLSLTTYTTIVKTSYSALTVLLRVRQD